MKPVRLHPLHFLRYVKYILLLCALPLVRAALALDLAGLQAAAGQSLLLAAACAGVLAALRGGSMVWLQGGFFCLQQGVLLRRRRQYTAGAVSAVELSIPFWFRPFGAARLRIWFKAGRRGAPLALTLPRTAAARLACVLIPPGPVGSGRAQQTPSGGGRLTLALLSANLLATALASAMAVQRLSRLLGQQAGQWALNGLNPLRQLLAAFLPAGVAVLLTLLLAVGALSLLGSLARTWRFTARRLGGVLICRGGLWTHTRRRIRLSAVTASTIRVTPAARLLGQRPVYLAAGSFDAADLPLVTLRRGEAALLQQLLPEYCPPEGELCSPRRKSPAQYLWKPGAACLLVGALAGVSVWALPAVTPALGLLGLLALAQLAAQLEALFREGVCRNKNHTLSLVFTRGLTRREVTLYSHQLRATLTRLPTAAAQGRCDLALRAPGGQRYRVRGIELYRARALRLEP